MTTFWRVQVEVPFDTLEPRDKAVNTWHFESNLTGTEGQQSADITNALLAFYGAIDANFSANVASPGRIRIYDLEHAPPRLPTHDDTFSIEPGIGVGLPNEVAGVLSYQGPIVSGTNRRRNRGRIYLGPWQASVIEDQTGDMRFSQGFIESVANNADTFLLNVATPLSGADIVWSLFSRSNALGLAVGEAPPATEPTYTSGQLTAGFSPVVEASMDNAVDIIRKRGLRPTSRYTVT